MPEVGPHKEASPHDVSAVCRSSSSFITSLRVRGACRSYLHTALGPDARGASVLKSHLTPGKGTVGRITPDHEKWPADVTPPLTAQCLQIVPVTSASRPLRTGLPFPAEHGIHLPQSPCHVLETGTGQHLRSGDFRPGTAETLRSGG